MKKRLMTLLMIAIPVASYATLGESASSINTDNKVLASSASIVKTQVVTGNTATKNDSSVQYQVSTIQATGNITIKEYVSSGKVFAVSWSGMRNPDLQQLLGKYFPEFKTTKSANSGLRESKVSSGDLVVNIHGVTGDFHGVAYASSLVPTGFNIQDLYK